MSATRSHYRPMRKLSFRICLAVVPVSVIGVTVLYICQPSHSTQALANRFFGIANCRWSYRACRRPRLRRLLPQSSSRPHLLELLHHMDILEHCLLHPASAKYSTFTILPVQLLIPNSSRLYRGAEGNTIIDLLTKPPSTQCLAQAALTNGAQVMTTCATMALVIQVHEASLAVARDLSLLV